MNLCRACNENFGSVLAFDKHRVGKHAYTFKEGLMMYPPKANGRRCLSTEEMVESGFVKNTRDTWSLQETLEKARGLRK